MLSVSIFLKYLGSNYCKFVNWTCFHPRTIGMYKQFLKKIVGSSFRINSTCSKKFIVLHDVASAHFSLDEREWLHLIFPNRWI